MENGRPSRRVLITGASGNLGAKLRAHLEARGGFDLRLLDRKAAPEQGVLSADLSKASAEWAHHFRGVDCVVHLAAEANTQAEWQLVLTNNIDATINVFEVAVAEGVKRVVFASSLQTLIGHSSDSPIRPDTPTKPQSLYGVSKVVGERLARNYAERHGLSVVCLRVGLIPPGLNPARNDNSLRAQQRWLSNADFCTACERAILVESPGFQLLHLTSRNAGSPWDTADTERVLGFRFADESRPVAPPRWRRTMNRLRRELRARIGRWRPSR